MSYALATEFRGCGIATEAAVRLLSHAFNPIGLDRVMAVIMAGNKVSRRVLRKLGMRSVARRTVSRNQLKFFRIEAP